MKPKYTSNSEQSFTNTIGILIMFLMITLLLFPQHLLATKNCHPNILPLPDTILITDTLILDEDGEATLAVGMIDHCDNPTLPIRTLSKTNFDCGDVGYNLVYLYMTNLIQTDTCLVGLIVQDTTPPTLNCKPEIQVRLDPLGVASITFQDVIDGLNDACGILHTFISKDYFTCDDVGDNEIIVTAIDVNFNISHCTLNVYVVDFTPPSLNCVSKYIFLDENGTATVTPNDFINSEYDECGIAERQLSQNTFDCADIGPIELVLTIADNNGNQTTCTISTEVFDTLPPTMFCNDLTVNLDPTGYAEITPQMLDGGITDPCGIRDLILNLNSFNCILGDYAVTISAFDTYYNLNQCTINVTVTGSDEDGDSVHDFCDLCHGGNDLIDNNGDGIPDCSQSLPYADYPESWQAGKDKVLICHRGRNMSMKTRAIKGHLAHGDYVGPCNDAGSEVAIRATEPEYMMVNELRIYPNPSNSYIHLEADKWPILKGTIIIQDQLGKLVVQKEIDAAHGIRERIDLQTSPPGVYYLKISDGAGWIVRKLIVVK